MGLAHEVLGCFTAYEAALVSGDAAATDAWFADDTRTVRFGIGEEQWGADQIRRWRREAAPLPAGRRLMNTRVDVWADNLAVVTTLFAYPRSSSVGRQSQTWLRTGGGWRIVHAHVSQRP
ncbi:MAG: AtzH-like domain-containing protein [Dermatophilaceae bacterium]